MKWSNMCESPYPVARCMRMLMIAFLFSTPVLASPENAQEPGARAQQTGPGNTRGGIADEVVFSGNLETAWRLYLGSMSNWMVPIEGPETSSYKSKVVTVRTIDHQEKADAYQAEWNGGLGQVYWQGQDALDLNTLESQGAALSMVILIDKQPKKSVDLKMDCGYPCAGSLSMTNLFRSVPQDQWFRVSFKLTCFREAGANLGNILAPLVVATKGVFKMSFADVRITLNPPPESMVACG